MGWAAIFVIACHAVQYGVSFPPILRRILGFGNLGVDIFLLLSGLGCYYSLCKKTTYRKWIRKRLIRIAVPYLVIHLILLLFEIPLNKWNFWDWLYYMSTIKFWIAHKGDWFVALLIPLYIITPLLWKLFNINKFRTFIFLLLSAFLLFLSQWEFDLDNYFLMNIIVNIQFAIKRIPAFLLGLYIAPSVQKGCSINFFVLFVLLGICCFITHRIFPSIFLWGFYVLPLTIIVCIITKLLRHLYFTNNFLTWIGKCSLESYLANVGIKAVMPFISCYLCDLSIIFSNLHTQYILVIFGGLFITHLGHIMGNNVTHFITEQSSHR